MHHSFDPLTLTLHVSMHISNTVESYIKRFLTCSCEMVKYAYITMKQLIFQSVHSQWEVIPTPACWKCKENLSWQPLSTSFFTHNIKQVVQCRREGKSKNAHGDKCCKKLVPVMEQVNENSHAKSRNTYWSLFLVLNVTTFLFLLSRIIVLYGRVWLWALLYAMIQFNISGSPKFLSIWRLSDEQSGQMSTLGVALHANLEENSDI